MALLTGGAQGITARAAVALAERGYRVELVGRSPLPGPEDATTADASDDPADLRRALVDAGERDPRAIEAAVARIARERSIRTTLALLDAAGAQHRYHPADVRDQAAIHDVVGDVLARHGRLDLVVHGAGVLDDRLLADKDAGAFSRVVDTKVEGADALLTATAGVPCRVVLFGSIAGVYGNRGQVDYATANDALDGLAHADAHDASHPDGGVSNAPTDGRRVVAVDWGPWAGGGMVGPSLEAEYARRGIGLIEPADGLAALLDLVADPDPPAQTVVMRADPTALDPDGVAVTPDPHRDPR